VDAQSAIAFLESWGYPLFALLLAATGVGSPIPEDLLLLAAGYLIAVDVFAWHVALPLAYSGVVVSDCTLYWIGTRIRTHSGGWGRRLIHLDRVERFGSWFRHGAMIVMLARLVPGTRAVVFVGAGLRGIPFTSFLLYDAIGSAIWVPALLVIGAQFGERLGDIEQVLARMANALWLVVVASVLLAVAWRYFLSEESKL